MDNASGITLVPDAGGDGNNSKKENNPLGKNNNPPGKDGDSPGKGKGDPGKDDSPEPEPGQSSSSSSSPPTFDYLTGVPIPATLRIEIKMQTLLATPDSVLPIGLRNHLKGLKVSVVLDKAFMNTPQLVLKAISDAFKRVCPEFPEYHVGSNSFIFWQPMPDKMWYKVDPEAEGMTFPFIPLYLGDISFRGSYLRSVLSPKLGPLPSAKSFKTVMKKFTSGSGFWPKTKDGEDYIEISNAEYVETEDGGKVLKFANNDRIHAPDCERGPLHLGH